MLSSTESFNGVCLYLKVRFVGGLFHDGGGGDGDDGGLARRLDRVMIVVDRLLVVLVVLRFTA